MATWRRTWQPTLVFLPGESHGQRALVGYSPWGCKRDTTQKSVQCCSLSDWTRVTWRYLLCLKRAAHSALDSCAFGHNVSRYPSFSPREGMWVLCLVTLSCLTLCDPMDCGQPQRPGSSVHGVLQARILEWAAMPSSKRSSQPRDWTQVSHISGRFFTIWAIKEDQERAWA